MVQLEHAIWWHVYPLGAVGAPVIERKGDDAAPRLARLVVWLDYVVELGCSGLLLGPVFDSTSHGYDTVDHFRIDPRLGGDDDFDRFIDEARRRGLHVMLDGVFNHVGALHRYVSEAVGAGGGMVRVRHEGGHPTHEPWEGHGDLALLDHDNPSVVQWVGDVMLHWLRRGIVGWRLDVAYAVPAHVWRTVIDRVRGEFPEAVFLGEVIHGDYGRIATEAHFDSVTQYELWKAIWSAQVDRNCWELAAAIERHEQFGQMALMNTFVGNHDVDRIAGKVGDEGAALAAVILLTLPGMPSIYYGDEQGFRGAKGEGIWADTPLRPELPATPADLSLHGRWMYELYTDLIGLRRRNAWLARGSVQVEHKENERITWCTRGEGHEMRAHLFLATARAEIEVDGAQVFTWQGAGEATNGAPITW